jgi:hypothetical protein
MSTVDDAPAIETPEALPPLTVEHPACGLIRKVDRITRILDAAKKVAARGGFLGVFSPAGLALMDIHDGLSPRPEWISNRDGDPLPALRTSLRWAAESLADAIRDANGGGANAERYMDSAAFNAARASNTLMLIYQRGGEH